MSVLNPIHRRKISFYSIPSLTILFFLLHHTYLFKYYTNLSSISGEYYPKYIDCHSLYDKNIQSECFLIVRIVKFLMFLFYTFLTTSFPIYYLALEMFDKFHSFFSGSQFLIFHLFNKSIVQGDINYVLLSNKYNIVYKLYTLLTSPISFLKTYVFSIVFSYFVLTSKISFFFSFYVQVSAFYLFTTYNILITFVVEPNYEDKIISLFVPVLFV